MPPDAKRSFPPLDKRYPHRSPLWHPCSQMQDYEGFPPLPVVRAEGSDLILADGRRVLDAISSWWCKSLGHGHPRLREALIRQANQMEHVILANTTNPTVAALADELAGLMPTLEKVFFAGDGSTAVEVAVKMALQARKQMGRPEKTRFAALENGYHGESALTLALGDLGLYKAAYAELMPPVEFVQGLPYRSGEGDPGWMDASREWPAIEAQLEGWKGQLAGIVFEPVLQGAGGMLLYSPDFLLRLERWCRNNDVFLIADEILTGLGRTGRALACEHAGANPDFLCLSKSLTAGWLPFSCVLTRKSIFEVFYGPYESGKAFLHSNTFTGNPLGAALALEALNIYREEGWFDRVREGQASLRRAMEQVSARTGSLQNPRGLGAMVAADLKLPREAQGKRTGYSVYKEAVGRGVLLRPLGDTLYWLPPFNLSPEDLDRLQEATAASIEAVMG